MSATHLDVHGLTCGTCDQVLTQGKWVFIHAGEGQEHPFHLACIKQVANRFFHPRCPCCHTPLDTDSFLTFKDHCITVLHWVKQGGIIGGVIVLAGGILFAQETDFHKLAYTSSKGAIFGALVGLVLRTQSYCLSKLYNMFYRNKDDQVFLIE